LKVAAWAAEGMRAAAEWGAEGAVGEWRVPPPPGWLAALAGLSLLGWAAGLGRGGRAAWAGAAGALAVFACIAVHPFPAALETGKLELTAIDVGQGDALLLGLPDGTAALVDAGGVADFRGPVSVFDIGEDVVSPYLWSRSIRRLRALALTHPDADHVGGAAAILRNFEVEELWLGRGTFAAEYHELVREAERRDVRVVWLGEGDVRVLGGAVIEILAPGPPAALDRNDLSLALLARYGRHEFLLTGDLEAAGEALLAKRLHGIDGEVLKAGHHGSRTSSTAKLVDTFRPEFAVISAGRDNLYGHPHADTLNRLRSVGARILRTDQRGLISILSDGGRLEVR
jgi:competence protein ComEC